MLKETLILSFTQPSQIESRLIRHVSLLKKKRIELSKQKIIIWQKY